MKRLLKHFSAALAAVLVMLLFVSVCYADKEYELDTDAIKSVMLPSSKFDLSLTYNLDKDDPIWEEAETDPDTMFYYMNISNVKAVSMNILTLRELDILETDAAYGFDKLFDENMSEKDLMKIMKAYTSPVFGGKTFNIENMAIENINGKRYLYYSVEYDSGSMVSFMTYHNDKMITIAVKTASGEFDEPEYKNFGIDIIEGIKYQKEK